ncbi:MAG TPA: hypothetical protein VGL54_05080 [Solirubrobacteraceae bacterium]|jgi:hypothetical protein
MPSSVRRLFAAVGLEPEGCVPWRATLPEKRPGIYVVSQTSSARGVSGGSPRYPVSKPALDQLLRICPELTVDGHTPTRSRLGDRIGSYWLSDETVLYIGLAGTSLRERVRSYYTTPLGASKPHKGGWWLKTLANLDQLYVHYAVSDDVKDDEDEMLRAFASHVSRRSRQALPSDEPVMPFANLRDGDYRRQRHRIKGETTDSSAG